MKCPGNCFGHEPVKVCGEITQAANTKIKTDGTVKCPLSKRIQQQHLVSLWSSLMLSRCNLPWFCSNPTTGQLKIAHESQKFTSECKTYKNTTPYMSESTGIFASTVWFLMLCFITKAKGKKIKVNDWPNEKLGEMYFKNRCLFSCYEAIA